MPSAKPETDVAMQEAEEQDSEAFVLGDTKKLVVVSVGRSFSRRFESSVLTAVFSSLALRTLQYPSKLRMKITPWGMHYATSSIKTQMSNSAATPYHILRKL